MNNIIGIIIATLLVSAVTVNQAQAQTACNDGSYSNSSGSGTCSYHGGEDRGNHWNSYNNSWNSYNNSWNRY